MNSILTPELTTAALEIVGMILGLILSAVAMEFRRRTGIEIEIKQELKTDALRARLDEVIRRAVEYAKTRVENEVKDRSDIALEYVLRGARETLQKLGSHNDNGVRVLRDRINIELKKDAGAAK